MVILTCLLLQDWDVGLDVHRGIRMGHDGCRSKVGTEGTHGASTSGWQGALLGVRHGATDGRWRGGHRGRREGGEAARVG